MVIAVPMANVSDPSARSKKRDLGGIVVLNRMFRGSSQGIGFTRDSSRRLNCHSNFLPMIAPSDRTPVGGKRDA
jgi:hypothetical protein